MRTNTRRLTTQFARPTRFSLKPVPVPASRGDANARLTALKDRLTRQHLAAADSDSAVLPAVQRAANDAASLAWATAFPLLVFPLLLEERVALERCQTARQEYIRRRSAALLPKAA